MTYTIHLGTYWEQAQEPKKHHTTILSQEFTTKREAVKEAKLLHGILAPEKCKTNAMVWVLNRNTYEVIWHKFVHKPYYLKNN